MMAMGSTLGRSKWKCARASRRLLTSHAAPRRPLYAILVDAENARRKALPFILEEVAASIQPVPGHATRACLCQIGRRWLRRPFSRRPRNGAVLRCSVINNLEQKAKTRFKSSKQRRRRRRRPRRRRRRRPPRRPGGVPCMIAARIQNASCVVTILTSVPAPRTPPRESAPPVMPLKHTPHHAAYIP